MTSDPQESVQDVANLEYLLRETCKLTAALSEIRLGDGYDSTLKEILRVCREEFKAEQDVNLIPASEERKYFDTLPGAEEHLRTHNYFQLTDEGKIYVPLADNGSKSLGVLALNGVVRKLLNQNEEYKGMILTALGRQCSQILSLAMEFERVTQLANYDELTRLANERHFHTVLDREYAAALKDKTPLALLMADLDNFKGVNDNYGHAHGDVVLKTFARVLSSRLRVRDLPARYGHGEEFFVLLPVTDADAASLVAERIRYAVEKTQVDISKVALNPNSKAPYMHGTPDRLTCSIGLTIFDPNIETSIDWVKMRNRADKALYDAKANGRNKVEVYTPK